MTRRPVRGLAPQPAREPAPRPPGPPSILHPDGRTFARAEDGLYYSEDGREVFSQSALRDLIDRAGERLARDIARTGDPILIAISLASSYEALRALHDANANAWTSAHTTAARGRRAALEVAT